jgi:methylated-DNA-[protein]-cysteine S-methyltransferase
MAYAPYLTTVATPIGTVSIEGDDAVVTRITINTNRADNGVANAFAKGAVLHAALQIREYFDGMRREFDLPLVPLTSPRGEALRAAIACVGYGETLSYGALAKVHDSGARAVGGACAHNLYPIVIPCHRVTSRSGAKENYSAGDGPSTKAWLIAHEARHSGRTLL